jgi:GT2 family glycosyltransferase
MQLDERDFLADRITSAWNLFSRITKWAAGSFIFCQAEAFRMIGGFDLALFASEELDLSKRLKKLARVSGKKMVILHRHPLLTSARKVHLYSRGEMGRFFRNAVLRPRRTLTNREACGPWYDGRR